MTLRKLFLGVSIPQAVSTVATYELSLISEYLKSFNTASGKYCCNDPKKLIKDEKGFTEVSIPQAVSTVATKYNGGTIDLRGVSFNTASGKYCCNKSKKDKIANYELLCFNTASGKYCCNT